MENQLPRLTVKEIRNETLKFFNLEKGMAFTYVSMLKKPLKTIRIYFDLDRKRFTNPLRYVLFSVAAYVLILNFHPSYKSLNTSMEKRNANSFAPIEKKLNISIAEPLAKAQKIYTSNQSIVYLILIPLVSVITFWFFKEQYNYAENLAINAFMFGTTNWTSAIVSVLTIFINKPFYLIISLLTLSIIITVYLYKNFFKLGWLKAVGTGLLVYFIITVVGMIFQFGLAGYFMMTAT